MGSWNCSSKNKDPRRRLKWIEVMARLEVEEVVKVPNICRGPPLRGKSKRLLVRAEGVDHLKGEGNVKK